MKINGKGAQATVSHFIVYASVVSNGLLNIKLDKTTNIQIFNSDGSLIMLKELQPGVHQLKLEKLPAGVYRIRAHEETASFIIPFTVSSLFTIWY